MIRRVAISSLSSPLSFLPEDSPPTCLRRGHAAARAHCRTRTTSCGRATTRHAACSPWASTPPRSTCARRAPSAPTRPSIQSVDSARRRANTVCPGSLDTIELTDADAGYIPEREHPSVLRCRSFGAAGPSVLRSFPLGPHRRMAAAAGDRERQCVPCLGRACEYRHLIDITGTTLAHALDDEHRKRDSTKTSAATICADARREPQSRTRRGPCPTSVGFA